MSSEAKKKTTAKKKGLTRRQRSLYPGLDNRLHPKARAIDMDGDYYNKLNSDESAWMSKFNEEYYGADLANKDDWYGRKKDLHRLKKDRKACRDRTNRRNRDIYSLNIVVSKIDNIDDKSIKLTLVEPSNPHSHEDTIISLLDLKTSITKSDVENDK